MSHTEIDSIKTSLTSAITNKNTKEIINCYNALAEEYRKFGDLKNIETAIFFHKQELKICKDQDAVEEYALASRFLGDCYRDFGDFANAKKNYQMALYLIRQDCKHVTETYLEHICDANAIEMERYFFSVCQNIPLLIEYYRALCNLGLTYLNESVTDNEKELFGESDFHILYRSIPLFKRSYRCIKQAERLHLQTHVHSIEDEREDHWNQRYLEILLFKTNALSNLGLAYEDGGDLKRSTEYLFKTIYMQESFQKIPKNTSINWKSSISKAKHNLGTCYLKLNLTDESEYYLNEDLFYCQQLRSQTKPNTDHYFESCINEGQTHLSLGTLHLHHHTSSHYQQAKRYYEKALICFKQAGRHGDHKYQHDAIMNLNVLEATRGEMIVFRENVKDAENEENEENRLEKWKSCCEEVLKFEQLIDEIPFMEYRNSAEKCHGKNSAEFAESCHLYSEYLYSVFSASEDLVKLSEAKKMCEEAMSVWRERENELELAAVMELYASVLSAIHDEKNDELEISSYLEASSLFSHHQPSHHQPYLTNLSNLIITYNRVGQHQQAKSIKELTDQIRQHSIVTTSLQSISQSVNNQPISQAGSQAVKQAVKQSLSPTHSPTHSDSDSDSDNLFSPEGFSQVTRIPLISGDLTDSETSSDIDSHGDLGVLAEVEVDQESGEFPRESQEIVDQQEQLLKTKISQNSENPLSLMKSRLKYGRFLHQQNRFTEAAHEFRCVQSQSSHSLKNESVFHQSSRLLCESVCSGGDVREGVRVMMKDLDVIACRRVRCGEERRGFYDRELCWSCEEMGYCWMSLYDKEHSLTSLTQAKDSFSRSLHAARRSDPSSISRLLLSHSTALIEEGRVSEAETQLLSLIHSPSHIEGDDDNEDILRLRANHSLAWLLKEEERVREAFDLLTHTTQLIYRFIKEDSSQLIYLLLDLAAVITSRFGDDESLNRILSQLKTQLEHYSRSHNLQWIQLSLNKLNETQQLMLKWNTISTDEFTYWLNQTPAPVFKLESFIHSNTSSHIRSTFFLINQQYEQLLIHLTPHTHSSFISEVVAALTHRLTFATDSPPKDPSVDRPLSRQKVVGFLKQIRILFPTAVPETIIEFTRESDDDDDDLLVKIRNARSGFHGRVDETDRSLIHLFNRGTRYQAMKQHRTHRERVKRKQRNREIGTREKRQRVSLPESREIVEIVEDCIESSPEDTRLNDRLTDRLVDRHIDTITNTVNDLPNMDTEHTDWTSLQTPKILTISVCCVLHGQEFHSTITLGETPSLIEIQDSVKLLVKNTCGVLPIILRIVLNNCVLGSSPHLTTSDEITAYCGIPDSSPILDGLQHISSILNHYSTGLFSLYKTLSRSNPVQSCTYQSISSLSLSQSNLTDLDIFIICSVLCRNLSSLTTLTLSTNYLTDTAAALLAKWINCGYVNQLIHIDLSENIWCGNGLRDLMTIIRQRIFVNEIKLNGLRMNDETIKIVISIFRAFIPNMDPINHITKGFVFHAKFLRISANAKNEMFSSFDGISLEELDLEGNEIPTDAQFRFCESIRRMSLLARCNISFCKINLSYLCHLLSQDSLPSVNDLNLSNNCVGDVGTRASFGQNLAIFVKDRVNVRVNVKGLGVERGLNDEWGLKVIM